MNYCQTCGKPISEFDTSRINGIDECGECATKTMIARKNRTYHIPKMVNNSQNKYEEYNTFYQKIGNTYDKSALGHLKIIITIQLIFNCIASFFVSGLIKNDVFETGDGIFPFLSFLFCITISSVIFAIENVFTNIAIDIHSISENSNSIKAQLKSMNQQKPEANQTNDTTNKA